MIMMLRVKALVTTPSWKAGTVAEVEDGAKIRRWIENGRFELLEEVPAAASKRKSSGRVPADPPAQAVKPDDEKAELPATAG